MTHITTRYYQDEANDAVAWGARKNNLLVMATGCGKTFTAAQYVAQYTFGKVLWIAHRTELIDQAAKALTDATGLRPEIEKASSWARDEINGGNRLVVASVQTLSAKWTNSIRAVRFDPREFDLVVVDEAHHATAASYRRILDHFVGVPRLGLTATPKRADKKKLGLVFDRVAYEFPIRRAVDEGWLVKPRVTVERVGGLDLSAVRTTAGDLNGADLAKALLIEEPFLKMSSVTRKRAGDRSTLVFCVNVEHATRMAEILRRSGATAEVVTGKTKDEVRKQLFTDFNAGDLQFLCNVGVCTEGTDLPIAEVVVMCRPTKSPSLLTQMIGRVLRPYGVDLHGLDVAGRIEAIASSSKPFAEVVDFIGDAGRHKLVSPLDVLGGDDLDPAVRDRALRIIEESESDEPSDPDIAIEQSVDELAAETKAAVEKAEALRLQIEARRANLWAESSNVSQEVDPFDLFDIPRPTGLKIPTHVEMASATMVGFLKRQGIANAELLTKAEANQVNKKVWGSIKGNKATVGQRKILVRFGYAPDSYTKDGASKIIDRIAKNGWKES